MGIRTGTTDSQLVDPDKIDDHPGPYTMSFGFNIRPLVQSINRVGLVNDPLFIENEYGGLSIVAGYRRVQAIKSLGWDRIPAKVLSKTEQSPLECLLLNLYDNLATRKLNGVENAMVLSRLSSWVPLNEIVEIYMPLLGLPAHEPTLRIFFKLEQETDADIKEYLVQKKTSFQVIKMLLEMEPDTRCSVFKLISDIKFNINQQKQLIDYINDMSIIKNKPALEILKESSLKKIVQNDHLNNPQKAKAILKNLRDRRFPLLVKAEKAFRKKVSKLDLPKGSTICAPHYFEKPHYRLEVLFKEGKELKKTISRLSQTEGLEALRDPWEKDG